MKEWIGKVYENRDVGGGYKVLTISLPSSFEEPIAGTFIMLDCGFLEDGILLRRPMAFYDFEKTKSSSLARVLYHVVGKGTKLMSNMEKDEDIRFLGPLGNTFSAPTAEEKVWVVAGGIGIAPFLLWLKQIQHRKHVKVLLGFREDAQLAICSDFQKFSSHLVTCVQHGSKGNHQGTVIDVLKKIMTTEKPDRILTCGPTIMMDKTIEVAKEHGIPVEVSLEAKMGCGIGVCLSCVTPLEHRNQKNTFSLVCKDGPIFTV